MTRLVFNGAVCATVFALAVHLTMRAQVNVTTQHNDNARTGQNTNETLLTPSNVTNNFGLITAVHVDGNVYAQPLVLTGVSIGGGTHDVVYVATTGNSVYALDAYTGAQYWERDLDPPVPIAEILNGNNTGTNACEDIYPQVGITSTPVIDPATGRIYVVANTKEGSNPPYSYHYRLYSLDVTTGTDTTPSADISDPGNTFNAQYQNQRTGLLLTNGHVVFGFSSHCDAPTWYGYVFSYDASTLGQDDVFIPVQLNQGAEAGVWAADTGLAADASGNVYLVTGNGTFDGYTAFGDSILKLPPPPASWSTPGAPADYFTPSDQLNLMNKDLDLGSGGVVLLPDLQGSGQQLLVQAGKEGAIYVVDRNHMGTYFTGQPSTNYNGIVQEIDGQIPVPNGGDAESGMYGVPTYWDGPGNGTGTIYFSALRDNVRAFSFDVNSGNVSPMAVSAIQCNGGNAPGEPHFSCPTSISSSGTSNGILWALESSSSSQTPVLHALDPSSLNELYSSMTNSRRDMLNVSGTINFVTPTVANGYVYVGAANQVGIYGLNPPVPPQNWQMQFDRQSYGYNCSGYPFYLFLTQSINNPTQWYFYLYINGSVQPQFNWTLSDDTGTLASGTWNGNVGVNPPFYTAAPVGTPQLTLTYGWYNPVYGCSTQLDGTVSGYLQ